LAEKTARETEEKRAYEASTVHVNIRKILRDYDNNEVGADNAYKGKVVQLTGVVREVKKDLFGHQIFVILGTGKLFEIPAIQAFFDKSMTDELGRLSKGMRLTVVCRVKGLLMNVLLENCSIR